ncbi:heavy metal translocating P-type ATPase [Corynebacterium alimapuense]|uniref:Metal-transporting ATPase n=1 Tax=Corynebacterium alimapuense TaxID=1576874 RepID=A0A3M8K6W0_9CORY|nr:HAD family hydrolase [Corynebacterium alimapuense]RNE48951.1 metal-transporting ATPase [Corynebacterium alimapuense]
MDRNDEQVASSIELARSAARAAGFDDQPHQLDQNIDPTDRPKVSYAFELDGLKNAPDIADIEAALEQVPGVLVRIVYPEATAWVTAPDTLDPDVLVEIIAGFDVSAVLTDSSLRRRVQRALPGEGLNQRTERRNWRRRRGMSLKFRRHLDDEARNLEKARRAGFLKQPIEGIREPEDLHPQDLLFTARGLLTTTRLVIVFFLTVPVLLMSYVPSMQFDGWQWVTLALATPVVTWGAWPFHRAMVGGLRRGLTALDAASSVAIIAAYVWSLIILIFTTAGDLRWRTSPQWFAFNHDRITDGELFLDVACGMTLLLLAGRLLTMRSRVSLLDEIEERRPDAQKMVLMVPRHRSPGAPKGKTRPEQIPLQEINVGDDIIVTSGQIIPVDGTVVGGSCKVGRGLIATSEQEVEEAKVNSYVYAGTRNLDGRIKVRVAYTGHRTRLAAIHRWAANANVKQNKSTMLSSRTAAMLIPVALSLATIDFLLWALISGNFNAAFATSLAVLASVAPVALAMSPALAIRYAGEAAARNGILIRDSVTIRRTEMVDTVIFNRVGTLAEPDMLVETITADRGENPELVLRVAGALALESDHPVSRALVRAAREARDSGAGGEDIPHWIDVHHAEINHDGDFTGLINLPSIDSEGVEHRNQVDAMLWRPRNMADLEGRLAVAAVSGGTPLVVRWKGRDRGVITLYDSVKPDAEDAIAELENQGIDTMMLSRDAYPVARRIANRIGIDQVLAGIAPGRKPQTVRSVHTRGATVAMVGDVSVLDSLRVSDVAILMGTDTQVDRIAQSGHPDVDIIVLRSDVSAIPQVIAQARRVCRIIDRNIILAWTYNALALLASVAGVLHPMAATVLMLGSSLLIEARSNRARTFRR